MSLYRNSRAQPHSSQGKRRSSENIPEHFGADGDPLASGLATTACEEKGKRDGGGRRQEKAVIQSPAGAEE